MAALPGVIDVESGSANGDVEGTYEAVLNTERALKFGMTEKRNHAEVVRVVFDTRETTLAAVLAGFWENNDPTQGDRQGNDVGSNYRSAVYTHGEAQLEVAKATKDAFGAALVAAGRSRPQLDHHRDRAAAARLVGANLDATRQIVVFEALDCAFCAKFRKEISDAWASPVPIAHTLDTREPEGWTLEKPLFATPTIVMFENGKEMSRYTGYDGDKARFWQWLGLRLLDADQRRIAFESGTERAFTNSHLDKTRPATFVDSITGAALFRTDAKFDSGTGWTSFFQPLPDALTNHGDLSLSGVLTEVRSSSSGIHIGHVFHDGPPPTGKRYCINGNVLKFVPDTAATTRT